MNVLVTGAGGCLGRAVVHTLAAQGHHVRGTGRSPRPEGFEGAEWHRADLLSDDPGPLLEGREAVVHLAALVHRPDVREENEYVRANVDVTRRLIAAAPRARVVFSSTVGVYGRDADFHADETTACAPIDPYGRSKLEAERSVLDAGGTVLRLPVVYGPGDRGNVGRLMDAIRRRRFVMPAPGDRPRSMLGARNGAEAVRLALERPGASRLYLVTDARDVTLADLVQAIAGVHQAKVPAVPEALLAVPAAVGSLLGGLGVAFPLTGDRLRKLTARLTFSAERIAAELGYRPVTTFEEGIREAVLSR